MGRAIDLHGESRETCKARSARKWALALEKAVVRVVTSECDTCHLLSLFIR